jgi:hypothetical protein
MKNKMLAWMTAPLALLLSSSMALAESEGMTVIDNVGNLFTNSMLLLSVGAIVVAAAVVVGYLVLMRGG